MISFGKKLRQIRKAKGLTQKELSALSGIPVRTIQDYEREVRTNPGMKNLMKLEQALNNHFHHKEERDDSPSENKRPSP